MSLDLRCAPHSRAPTCARPQLSVPITLYDTSHAHHPIDAEPPSRPKQHRGRWTNDRDHPWDGRTRS